MKQLRALGLWGATAGLAVGALACRDRPPPTAWTELRQGPVQPAPTVVAPLPLPAAPIDEAPAAVAAVLSPGWVVDARVLVISADGTDPELAAIRQTLGNLGTPFDVMIAAAATLTASQLAAGPHGKYDAVILTRGNLVRADGTSAFSSSEFQTLADYEASFHVRRVSLDTAPDASYGYAGSVPQDTSAAPLATRCTPAGRAALRSVNCDKGVTISGAFAYPATPLDANMAPLLVDSGGRILAAIRSTADGREAMSLNFAQSPSLFHTLQLLPSVLSWATRGVFLGDRRAYVGAQIDDLFLADELYTGGTFRLSASDLQAAADYQNGKRAEAVTSGFRYNFAFNGAGASPADGLTQKAQQLGDQFAWIDHTWDHAALDTQSYSQVLAELTQNTAAATRYGLQPYSVSSLVPPGYTGLLSANATKAMFDAGVRYVVADASLAGYDNPTPNAGTDNPLQPQILMIPRRPTNLFDNVSTPDQWVAEYNDLYRAFWGRDLSYGEILDRESDVLAQDLLKGEADPWMFHQSNLRVYGSGRSVLADLLDQVLDKYGSRVTAPLVGPTLDLLGQRVAERMRTDSAGASGTIDPMAQTITIHVANRATVLVTGACGGTTELYDGQPLSSVTFPAGGSVTLPLSNGPCAGAGGSGGAGGGGGSGGVAGAGGSGGAAGGGGRTGVAGAGGAAGAGGRGGAAGGRESGGAGGVGGAGGAGGGGVAGSGGGGGMAGSSGGGIGGASGAGMGGSGGRGGMGGAAGGGGTSIAIPCTAVSVVAGQLGAGQSAAALAAAELTGTADVWTDYVELSAGARVVCTYTLPVGVSAASISALSLDVNYRGPSTETMTWAFEVLDPTTGTWTPLGDNRFAAAWVWTAHTFTLPAPASRYVSAGALQIRYGTTSTADASDLDQLLIRAAIGGGTIGTSFTLPCDALAVATGAIGAGQTAAALTSAELTGPMDVWTDYVELSPASRIVCTYLLPAGVSADTVTSLALQVSYRGPTESVQQWTFEVLDTTSGVWTLLGDNTFASGWTWTPQTFPVPAPLARFFSSSGTLQIRYGSASNADASDLDQMVITGTR